GEAMKPFRYERASDASTAVAMLAQAPAGAFLGGGTNLVDLMKLGVARPQLLIDISHLPYNRVELLADGGVRIGAAVRNSELDALVRVLGPSGERTIPLTSYHRLPGDEPQRDTVLEHGELITAVDLPPLSFAARSHYRKVRDRASYAFALVSVAAAIDVADGMVRDARVAFGGVAHVPWRATKAETVLRGAPATEEVFLRAAAAELAGAQPLRDNAFK